MQMRRLADLAFMFRLYELAYQIYYAAKKDFNNEHAWLHFAGVMVELVFSFNPFVLVIAVVSYLQLLYVTKHHHHHHHHMVFLKWPKQQRHYEDHYSQSSK